MALRLYSDFLSSRGTPWRVEIHDTDFVGTETEFPLVGAGGLELEYSGDSRQFSESLMPSEVSFGMLIRSGTDAETFYGDIVTSSETRFSVKVIYDSGAFWAGQLVPDVGDVEDRGPEFVLNLKASCGLGLLADYEYIDETPSGTDSKWTATITGFERLIKIIAFSLKKLPHIQTHYTGSTDFVRTGINWHHSASLYDDPDNTNDPLYNVYVLQSNFAGIQTSGNAKPMSCADVIDAILTAFNARITQRVGGWVIEQYETRTNLTDNRIRKYNYAIAAPSISSLDGNVTVDSGGDGARLAGGSFSFAKALKSVLVTLDAKSRYNLAEAMRFDETSASDYNAGNVFWDNEASTFRAKGTIAGTFNNTNIPPILSITVDIDLVFRLRVNLQSNFLEQTITYVPLGLPDISTMSWSMSTQYIEIPVSIKVAPAIGNSVDFSQDFDFSISTPTGTQGNLSVLFELDRVVNRVTASTISGSDYSVTFDMNNPYFAIYYDENIPIGKKTFEVFNGSYLHTATAKIKTIVGDREYLNDRGALRYLDGSDYLATLDWTVRDDVDGFKLSELLARRILQAQSAPRRMIKTTIYSDLLWDVTRAIEYDGVTYLFMGGTYNAGRDELSGNWIELNYEDITMSVAYNSDPDGSGYVGSSSSGTVNQNTSGGPVTGGSGGTTDGNGIYTGSGTVPDGTVATLGDSFGFSRTSASGGDEWYVTIDDGSNTNEIRAEAGTGVTISSSGDAISLNGETAFSDVVSPSTIGSDQNDYAGLAGANAGRLNASTAVNITGLAGGFSGRLLLIHNTGSNPITLVNASGSSAAANRFDIGEDYTIRASHGVLLQYDATASRWRIAAAHVLGRWTEGYTTSTATTASLSATSPATNITAAIVPKGNGAFTLAVANGSSSGGNARGTKAVDLQIDRNNAAQVASGTSSVVAGGRRNTASASYSAVGGGSLNAASASTAAISGGNSNTASGTAAFVGGGFSNTSSGDYTVTGGGVTNTASGTNATVGGGFSNTASGNSAVIFGGQGNTASGTYSSVPGGYGAEAYLTGQEAHSATFFSTASDAQRSFILLSREITGTAQTELFLDAGAASVRAILKATNRIWNFEVQVVGTCNTVGNGSGITAGDAWVSWHLGGIKRLNTSTALIGTVQTPATAQSDTGMSTTTVTIDADDTNESLRIRITPPTTAGSTTVTRWIAVVKLAELGY